MGKINFSVLASLTFCLALISRMNPDSLSFWDYAVIFSAGLLLVAMVFRFVAAHREP